MVVQHFELARERVALMHLDAAVAFLERDRAGRHFAKLQDRVLHTREQGIGRVGLEAGVVLHALAARFHQQVDVRLGLAAPGGEQAISDFLPLVASARRQVTEPLGRDHLEPVFGAGIDHVHMHLDPAAQRLQRLDVQGRHGGEGEDVDGRGQSSAAGQRLAAALQRLDQQRDGMIGGEFQLAGDALPQRRLPAFVGACRVIGLRERDVPPVLPLRQPVRAVGDVLLQQRRRLHRQLVAHHVVGASGLQVGCQSRLRGDEIGIAESAVDAPGQCRRIEGRLGRDAGHHSRHLPPQPARQEHELDVGADAFAVGQRQGHVAPHRCAGDDHLVGREDVVARSGHLGEQQIAQVFVAVGKVQMEHGTVG